MNQCHKVLTKTNYVQVKTLQKVSNKQEESKKTMCISIKKRLVVVNQC